MASSFFEHRLVDARYASVEHVRKLNTNATGGVAQIHPLLNAIRSARSHAAADGRARSAHPEWKLCRKEEHAFTPDSGDFPASCMQSILDLPAHWHVAATAHSWLGATVRLHKQQELLQVCLLFLALTHGATRKPKCRTLKELSNRCQACGGFAKEALIPGQQASGLTQGLRELGAESVGVREIGVSGGD